MRALACLALAGPVLTACAAAAPAGDDIGRGADAVSPVELIQAASSPHSDVRLAPSPDGETLLWGSDRPGGPGSRDIWMSRRTADGWSDPVPVPFDTDAREFDPAYAPDGRHVYFFSDRPGGLGGDDLYRVAVTADGFGPAEHLGESVNGPGKEWAPLVLRSGALLFATDGRGGRGGHDLFIARPDGDGFAPAEPVPGAINTPGDELDAAELASGDLVFARSEDLATRPVGLVLARRRGDGWDLGAELPPAINVAGGDAYGPSVDWLDPEVLYFNAARPGGPGKQDLYRVRLRVR